MSLLLYIFTFIILGVIMILTTNISVVIVSSVLAVLFYLIFRTEIKEIFFQKDIDEQQTEI